MTALEKIENILSESDDISRLKSELRKIDSKKYRKDEYREILHLLSIQMMIVSSFLEDDTTKRNRVISKAKSLYKI